MTMNPLTMAARVHAGAQLLSARVFGWYHTVDVSTLDMASTDFGVLGQLETLPQFDDTDSLFAFLGASNDNDAQFRYGFAVESGSMADYEFLTMLWADKIEELRETHTRWGA
jgi:hypothetical protein